MPKTPHSSRSRSPSGSKSSVAALAFAIVPQVLRGDGMTAGAAGEGRGTPLLISVSSFCLSARILRRASRPGARRGVAAGRRGGGDGRGRGGRLVRRLLGRRGGGVLRLDPTFERRRGVLGQHGDDLVGGLQQGGTRLGGSHPLGLLGFGDQPVEDREGDDRQQEAARRAEQEAERAIERADLAVENRVREADGEQRDDDQGDEEDRRRRDRLGDDLLVDVGRGVGHHLRVEIIGRRRRRAPGGDGEHFAGETAHQRQQGGDEDDAEHREIKIGRHEPSLAAAQVRIGVTRRAPAASSPGLITKPLGFVTPQPRS